MLAADKAAHSAPAEMCFKAGNTGHLGRTEDPDGCPPLNGASDMRGGPLVSVIMPAFNAQAFVREALESVQAQTYGNLEILVVDDGSTDDTVRIVSTVAKTDARFRLLHQAHAGVAAARNLAISHAAGKYIAPLDADDIWHPRKLELQVRCLEQSPATVGLVYAASVCIDEKGHPFGAVLFNGYAGEVLLEIVYANFLANASSPLIRRSCLARVGGYTDLRRYAQGSEDWDLYLRIAEQDEFEVVPEVLVGYRQVPGSLSSNYRGMQASHFGVAEHFRERHPELPDVLFRWSRARYYFYLRGRSYVCGDYWRSLCYLARAWRTDLLLLVSSAGYVSLMKCLARLVLPNAALRFGQPLISWLRRLKQLPIIPQAGNGWVWPGKGTWSSQPANLFERLHRIRLQKVKRAVRRSPTAAQRKEGDSSRVPVTTRRGWLGEDVSSHGRAIPEVPVSAGPFSD